MSEIRKVVKMINDKLFDDCDCVEHDYFRYLELVETPIGDYIKWYGEYLWDSENDFREWINDEEQEPLEDFLVREMQKLRNVLDSQLRVLKKIGEREFEGEELSNL